MKKGILILSGLFFVFCLVAIVDAQMHGDNESDVTEDQEELENVTEVLVDENDENITEGNESEVLDEEYSEVFDDEVLLSGEIQVGDEIRNVEVVIFENTTVDADEEWGGVINSPVMLEDASVVPFRDGYTSTVSKVIEVGFVGVKLVLDKAAKITIPGEAEKKVGYSYDGVVFYEIEDVCSVDNDTLNIEELSDEGDCYLFSEEDLIIWTKHFSEYVTYTEVENVEESNETVNESEDVVENVSYELNDEFDSLEEEIVRAAEVRAVTSGFVDNVLDRVRYLMAGLTGAVAGLGDRGRSAIIVLAVVGGVLFLFFFSILQGGLPGTAHFKRAAVFHKRAERAHLNGDYAEAKDLYEKSYSLREKGEDKILGGANDGTL